MKMPSLKGRSLAGLCLVSAAAAGTTDEGRTLPEAHRLLQRTATAYQAVVALEDTLTYELQVPGAKPEAKRLHYGFGARGEAFVDAEFIRAVQVGGRMYITRYDVPDRYVVGEAEGSFGDTLERLAGDLAALPEPVAITMREGRGVEAYLDALRFKILHRLEIADVRRAKSEDGAALHEIAFEADNGECLVRIDTQTGFLREIEFEVRPDGAPEGYEIRAEGRFDPRILASAEGLVRFDPAGRRAVPSLADLDSKRFPLGRAVPDFRLPSLAGDTVHLQDLRGSVVVLEFWATWCVPCWRTLQHAQEIASWAEKEGLPVVVLAVNSLEATPSPSEKRRRIGEFWRSQNLAMDPLLDLDDAVFRSLGSPGLPSTLIVGPDGTLAKYLPGTLPDMVESLQQEIRSLLTAPPQGQPD